ncbi:IMPACT family protein [Roseimarinus sediminis]|uniref:IMPACT family protein n=1 Tax=Roseimarinus sediminis TaxID=1610899 RepID=UPI003D198687
MEINDTYKTIGSNAEGMFKDKGSKFLAYAFPVETEDEIKAHLNELKKEHYSARHHCYAYRLGKDGEHYRANDDGEPSGTAGRPIHGQLMSHELTNLLVVVVRYFGGTLLGVSGLINAYKNATIDVLSNAKIIAKIVTNSYQLRFEYPLQNTVMRILNEYQVETLEAEYTTNCQLKIGIRLKQEEEVSSKLEKIEGLIVKKLEDNN